MAKAIVTLGGIALAGISPVVWRFQTGTQPYTTIFSVHESSWERDLKGKMGEPLTLKVSDGRGASIAIKDVYILHKTPSDSPHRVAFVVADKRWKWPYKIIVRDYNMTRKSGDRSILSNVPVAGAVTVDVYTYKQYSLKDRTTKWTAEDALTDILDQIEGKDGFKIDAFPVKAEMSLQNVILRDSADVAIGRLLSYIPATDIYVDQFGKVRVLDAADFKGAEEYYKQLPPNTWDGDKLHYIDKNKIRPAEVIVHYQREVEVAFEFEDDTTVVRDKNDPFLENVIPTTDPTSTIGQIRNAEGDLVPNVVPVGTWVEFWTWLDAMDDTRPAASFPWTFQTLSEQWIHGDLVGALGAKPDSPSDVFDDEGVGTAKINVFQRVAALKQHFRQTFRINPRYMERIRDIRDTTVGPRDPVTGARGLSMVWGQAAVKLSPKGEMIAARRDPEKANTWVQIDSLPPANKNLREVPPSPAKAVILDRDQGIFRVEWVLSPYATQLFFVPSNTVQATGTTPIMPSRDLSKQSSAPVAVAAKPHGKDTIWVGLKRTMEMKVILTILPASPNNKNQFYAETVKAEDVSPLFRSAFRIQKGNGPPMEVFIPPNEATARFAWKTDAAAKALVKTMLGLDSEEGLAPGDTMEGGDAFVFTNREVEIKNHSKAVAAEALSVYADNIEGRVATILPERELKLVAHMDSVMLQVGAHPSAKVQVIHDFPGQVQPLNHFALMSEGARHGILGIIQFGDER